MATNALLPIRNYAKISILMNNELLRSITNELLSVLYTL